MLDPKEYTKSLQDKGTLKETSVSKGQSQSDLIIDSYKRVNQTQQQNFAEIQSILAKAKPLPLESKVDSLIKQEPFKLPNYSPLQSTLSSLALSKITVPKQKGEFQRFLEDTKGGLEVFFDRSIPAKRKIDAVKNLPLQLVTGAGKGVLNFLTQSVPKSIATAGVAALDMLDRDGEYNPALLTDKQKEAFSNTRYGKFYKETSEKYDFISPLAKRASEYLEAYIDSVSEKQQKRSTELKEEHSFFHPERFGETVVEGSASFLAVIGLAVVTKSPTFATMAVSWVDSSDTYNDAKRKLQEDNPDMTKNEAEKKALGLALGETAVIAGLERISLATFLSSSGKGVVSRLTEVMLTEGVTEGAQQFSQNVIAKYGYDETQELLDGVFEAALIGFVAGGMTTGATMGAGKVRDIVLDRLDGKVTKTKEEEDVKKIKEPEFKAPKAKETTTKITRETVEQDENLQSFLTMAEAEAERIIFEETTKLKNEIENPQLIEDAYTTFLNDVKTEVELKGEKAVIKGLTEDESLNQLSEQQAKDIVEEALKEVRQYDDPVREEVTEEIERLLGEIDKREREEIKPETPVESKEEEPKVVSAEELPYARKTDEDILNNVEEGLREKAKEIWDEQYRAEFHERQDNYIKARLQAEKARGDEKVRLEQARDAIFNSLFETEARFSRAITKLGEEAKKQALEDLVDKEVKKGDITTNGQQQTQEPNNNDIREGTGEETFSGLNGDGGKQPATDGSVDTGNGGRIGGQPKLNTDSIGERSGTREESVDEQPKEGNIEDITEESEDSIVVNKRIEEDKRIEEETGYTREEIETLVKDLADIDENGQVVVKREPTEEERRIFNSYKTVGGTAKKGGTGQGLLDEYYTPEPVVDMVMGILTELNAFLNVTTVLEPSVGTGHFLSIVPQQIKGSESAKVYGLETNEITARITKLNNFDNKGVKIYNRPFESFFITDRGVKKEYELEKAQLVIGNPPYGTHRGLYKGLGEEPKIKRYENYFIKRSLDAVEEGGYVAMVVPSGILRSTNSETGKRDIARLGKLEVAFRLPNGVFDNTDVATDILVFKKETTTDEGLILNRLGLISDDLYFRAAPPNHILGEKTVRSGRFGPENAVLGNLEDAWERFQKTIYRVKDDGTPDVDIVEDKGDEKTDEDVVEVETEEDSLKEAKTYDKKEDFILSKQRELAEKFEESGEEIANIQADRHNLHSADASKPYLLESADNELIENSVSSIIQSLENLDITGTEKAVIDSIYKEAIEFKTDRDFEFMEDEELAEFSDDGKVRDEEGDILDEVITNYANTAYEEVSGYKEKVNTIVEDYLTELDLLFVGFDLGNATDEDNVYLIDTDYYPPFSHGDTFAPSGFARSRSVLGEGSNNTAGRRQDEKLSSKRGGELEKLEKIWNEAHKETTGEEPDLSRITHIRDLKPTVEAGTVGKKLEPKEHWNQPDPLTTLQGQTIYLEAYDKRKVNTVQKIRNHSNKWLYQLIEAAVNESMILKDHNTPYFKDLYDKGVKGTKKLTKSDLDFLISYLFGDTIKDMGDIAKYGGKTPMEAFVEKDKRTPYEKGVDLLKKLEEELKEEEARGGKGRRNHTLILNKIDLQKQLNSLSKEAEDNHLKTIDEKQQQKDLKGEELKIGDTVQKVDSKDKVKEGVIKEKPETPVLFVEETDGTTEPYDKTWEKKETEEEKQKRVEEDYKKAVDSLKEKVPKKKEDIPEFYDLKEMTAQDPTEQWEFVSATGELEGNFNPDLAYYMDGKYYNKFNYAQGDIYEKLDQLEKDRNALSEEKYQKQKQMLEEILPKQEEIEDLFLAPHINFVETTEVKNEDLRSDQNPNEPLKEAFKRWLMNLPREAFGGSNFRDIRDYVDGVAVRGAEKEKNAEVRRQRRTEGDRLFKLFLTNELSKANQKRVRDAYNRAFNSYVAPNYTKVALTTKLKGEYKGKALELRPVQKQGIGFLLNKGSGLLAHEVGLGKSLQGIIANIELIERGWAKRPLIVLPSSSVYNQFIKDVKAIKPDIKVNALGNLGGDIKKLGGLDKVKIEDKSLTFITTEGLKKLGFTEETYKDLTKELLDTIAEPKDLVKTTDRDNEKQKGKGDEIIGVGKRGTFENLTFESLGFDAITVDELQNYNHIIGSAKAEDGKATEFRGFSQIPSSAGIKLWLAAQYIQKNNNGRNVIGLSATPFTNHPLEYYSVLSLFARERMLRMGIRNVNDFMSMFMDIKESDEVTASGQLVAKTDVRGFKNNRQFQALLREFIDFREGAKEGVPRPERHQRDFIVPEDKLSYEYKLEAQQLFNEKNAGTLQAMTELQAIAFSPYLSRYYKGPMPDAKTFVKNSPKIRMSLEVLYESYKNIKNSNHIIYSNRGEPFLPLIKEYLVNEKGIPESEVELITGKTPKAKRSVIQDNFNAGKVRIIIGNKTIEEGINLQERSTDLYILSKPWNFTNIKQLIGRLHRPGNRWADVRVNEFSMENTFDVFLSQAIAKKQNRFAKMLEGESNYLDVGDVDYNELKGDLMTDPIMKVKFEVKNQLQENYIESIRVKADLAYKNQKFKQYSEAKEKMERWKRDSEADPESEWRRDNYKSAKEKFDKLTADLKEKGIEVEKNDQVVAEAEAKLKVLEEEKVAIEAAGEEKLERAILEKEQMMSTARDLEIEPYIKERRADDYKLFIDTDKPLPKFRMVGSKEVTLMTLEAIKEEVKKENISRGALNNFLNRPVVKAIEKETIRAVADRIEKDGVINVAELIKETEDELLVLTSRRVEENKYSFAREKNSKKKATNYTEMIYESDTPFISPHFIEDSRNYFAHVRTHDIDRARTLIEAQSDYLQHDRKALNEEGYAYRNIWWERMIREEIRRAAKDGMLVLNIPVGITAAKIQGFETGRTIDVGREELKVGTFIENPQSNLKDYIVSVDEEAVSVVSQDSFIARYTIHKLYGEDKEVEDKIKEIYHLSKTPEERVDFLKEHFPKALEVMIKENTEKIYFDRETQNNEAFKALPSKQKAVLKHYTEMGKYLKKAFNAKEVTDEFGETYVEMKVEKEAGDRPVYAYKKDGVESIEPAMESYWQSDGLVEEADRTKAEKDNEYKVRMEAATPEEVSKRVREYAKRHNFEVQMDFVDKLMMSVEDPKTRRKILKEVGAYGTYHDKKIVFKKKDLLKVAADHEILHLVLDNIENLETFTGMTREGVLTAANGGKNVMKMDRDELREQVKRMRNHEDEFLREVYTQYLDEIDTTANSLDGLRREIAQVVEEGVAFQFEVYVARREIADETTLGRFFKRLKEILVDIYRFFGGKLDTVAEFYDVLSRGEADSGKPKVVFFPKARDVRQGFDTSNGLEFYNISHMEREKRVADMDSRAAVYRLIEKAVDKQVEEGKLLHNEADYVKDDINLIESIIYQSRDIYLKNPRDFKAAEAQERIADKKIRIKNQFDQAFNTLLEPFFKLKPKEREKVEKALWAGDEEGKEFNERELALMDFSDEQGKAYRSVRRAFKVALEVLLTELKTKGVSDAEIATYRKRSAGYMPHKWQYPHIVRHQKLNETGVGYETWNIESFKTAKEAAKRRSELAKQYENDVTQRFATDTLASLEVDFFSSMELTSERMIKVIDEMKEKEFIKDEVTEILKSNLLKMFKEKGFGRHFLTRTGIKGYDTKNTGTTIVNYFTGLSGYVSKLRVSSEYFEVLSDIDARRQPQFFTYMRNLIAYDLNNKQEIQWARQVAFAYHLMNDLSYLLTNATQNTIVGYSELGKLFDNKKDALTKPEVYMTKAQLDWNTGNITDEEKVVIEGLLKQGLLGAEMVGEITGFKNNVLYNTISSAWRKIMYKSSELVEIKINRVPAFLAARRIFKEQGESDEMANTKALEVANDIHFRYGRGNRRQFMRGDVGVNLTIFLSHPVSLFILLYRNLSKGEFLAFGRILFYTTLIGGTRALPMATLILTMWRGIFDDDDDEVVEELEQWEIALTRGLPAAFLDVDMSNRVSISLMTAEQVAESPFDVRSYLGVIGSFIDRPVAAFKLLNQGRFLEALAKVTPDMVANPMKAFAGSSGVYSAGGTPLVDYDGDVYQYSTWEALVKGAGFQPTKEAVLWDQHVRQWTIDDKKKLRTAKIGQQIRAEINRGNIDKARELQRVAIEEGAISGNTDYIRKYASDSFFKTAVEEWENSNKTRESLNKIENKLIDEIYGGEATDLQRNNARKELAVYRQFGIDNEYATAIMNAATNKEKLSLLQDLRELKGKEEFKEFWDKGRAEMLTASGNKTPILISDNLAEMYLKEQK